MTIQTSPGKITFAVDRVEPAAEPLPVDKPQVSLQALAVSPVQACSDDATDCITKVRFHPLLAAASFAFNQHRPLVLSPAMIWVTIVQGAARHVNNLLIAVDRSSTWRRSISTGGFRASGPSATSSRGRRRAPWTGLMVGLLALILGCQFDPNGWEYTVNRPATADLVGVWDLNAAASDWRPGSAEPARARTIELRPDGSAGVVEIPGVWEFRADPDTRTAESGPATWKLERNQDRWQIRLDLAPILGSTVPRHDHLLSLAGQAPPYRIYVVLGDPDAGHKLVFERSKNAAPVGQPPPPH